jgi:hypothetical protein
MCRYFRSKLVASLLAKGSDPWERIEREARPEWDIRKRSKAGKSLIISVKLDKK